MTAPVPDKADGPSEQAPTTRSPARRSILSHRTPKPACRTMKAAEELRAKTMRSIRRGSILSAGKVSHPHLPALPSPPSLAKKRQHANDDGTKASASTPSRTPTTKVRRV